MVATQKEFFMFFALFLLLQAAPPPAVDLAILNECHRAARARDWKIGGDFEVRLTLKDTGAVDLLTVMKNTSADAIIERCVRFHLQNMSFPGRKSPLTLKFAFPVNQPQFGVFAADVSISRTPGNGTAARVLLHPGSVATTTASLTVLRIDRNGRFAHHVHQKTDVFLTVLEGTGRLDVWTAPRQMKPHPLSPGTTAFIPAGIPHELTGPSGEEPLVLLLWALPAKIDQFFLNGEAALHDVHFFPPPKSPDNPPATSFARTAELRFADVAFPKAAPVRLEKRTLVTVPKVGELALFLAPAGAAVTFEPPARGAFAFVARGGGELAVGRDTHVLQPGSGWYLPRTSTYTPKVASAPLFLIAFCSGGICSAR
jgi:quercetin dioxygenase-like cupin family protein